MFDSPEILTHALDENTVVAGRYRIIRSIGIGGMASVYLAHDRESNVEIALKILHKEFSLDKNYIERFLREAKLLSRIDHPNVVKMFDVGTDGELVFFTMEYVPGHSLEELMSSQSFSPSEVASLTIEICRGLEAIHSCEILHRDLKPGNILITSEGVVKITDFGVAREKGSRLTTKKQKLGAVNYIAPEVWLGGALTAGVDFYSLGVVLYELTTGELPFEGTYPGAVMMKHVEAPVIPPKEKKPNIPSWLNILITSLLSKSPAERPLSTGAIIAQVLPFKPSPTPEISSAILPNRTGITQPHKDETTRGNQTASKELHPTPQKAEAPRDGKRTVRIPLPRHAAVVLNINPPSRDFIALGIFLASLQIFDGVLTSLGVQRFGIEAEGNHILRSLMETHGIHTALFWAKLAAVSLIICVTIAAKRIFWIREFIGHLTCIYLFAAILPWLYFLFVMDHLVP